MSEARREILTRLRGESGTNKAGVRDGAWSSSAGPRPRLDGSALEVFVDKLRQNSASVVRVDSEAAIIKAIGNFLRVEGQGQGQGQGLVVMPHPRLRELNWPNDLEIQCRAPRASDLNVLSLAAFGIAETGSLVLLSGTETPSEANFLPENFLCLVDRANLIEHMEEVWQHLRQQGDFPACVNLISGPSRTADVEQTIQLGAHGPRRLLVVIDEGSKNE
ncbi:MAG: LUD domain-containing protein [Gammaproteobacteria bacterium]|nr:LUD domain-containing protein [Gammaproteobacteria bacterium]